MRVVRPPAFVRTFFGRYTWNMGSKDKIIYLTFDDGPTPDVTEKVLNVLDDYNVRATFFCIGRNVERNRGVFNEIINRGHSVGNHTYSHLKGIKTNNKQYFEDVNLAGHFIDSKIFRPPYGMIKRSQGIKLAKDYRVVMWDVLSYDFLTTISPEQCLHNVLSKAENGSIVVFHDSVKAKKNMEYALPRSIERLLKEGYSFKAIIN